VLAITLSIFTGYGLAGLRRRDQMFVYNIYLLQMVIPAMLILLPQYQMLQWVFNIFPQYAEPQIGFGVEQAGAAAPLHFRQLDPGPPPLR